MNIWTKLFKKKPVVTEVKDESLSRSFSTDEVDFPLPSRVSTMKTAYFNTFKVDPIVNPATLAGTAMDSSIQGKFGFQYTSTVPDTQIAWYGAQGFIGYQLAATLAQQWLISKACLMPAKDAIRNGYKITVNDGTEVDPDVLEAMRKADVRFNLNRNLVQFIQMGRIFGIRVAMFLVDTDNPEDYYFKPFNPDGIKPGSYRGISQIDPYWMTPELDAESAGDPGSPYFYEPTWWRINAVRVHRSHLVIYRTEELPDILKPTYLYGGIPIPQKIYERVYASERTANEAPMLAMTKRTDVLKVDLSAATAKEEGLIKRIQKWVFSRDNYGVKIIGHDDDMQQFDTSLTDLDAVIMTQYQLVAAAANVPATKLLGTSPKGFNTTGEFEEASYHEELESIQAHDLTPLIERHHLMLIRSEIAPNFNIAPFSTEIVWNPLDAMTTKEQAELNKLNAETGNALINSGAIDGYDERKRIINDPESGYSGLIDEEPIEEITNDPEEG